MNFEDDAFIYLVRDTVTGGYVTSSKYWLIRLSNLGPKSKAHIYNVQKNATALRNKVGREMKRDFENSDRWIKDNPPTDPKTIKELSDTVDDWDKRKNLPNYGIEVVKIKI